MLGIGARQPQGETPSRENEKAFSSWRNKRVHGPRHDSCKHYGKETSFNTTPVARLKSRLGSLVLVSLSIIHVSTNHTHPSHTSPNLTLPDTNTFVVSQKQSPSTPLSLRWPSTLPKRGIAVRSSFVTQGPIIPWLSVNIDRSSHFDSCCIVHWAIGPLTMYIFPMSVAYSKVTASGSEGRSRKMYSFLFP